MRLTVRLRFPMLALLVATAFISRAEEITLNDGVVLNPSAFRMNGGTLLITVTTPEGGVVESGYPISRIARVSFAEPSGLSKAAAAAAKGNSTEVLDLTKDFVARDQDFKALPGSWWPAMAALRLSALASMGRNSETTALARQFGTMNSPSYDSLSRAGVLFGSLDAADTEAIVVAVKSLDVQQSDQSAALAQLALGRALLVKKDYAGAIRAFLTIKVFHPSQESLQPAALYGAANAYEGLSDKTRAVRTLNEILENYPQSPQAGEAKKMIADLSKP